jgi:hypothetical protein
VRANYKGRSVLAIYSNASEFYQSDFQQSHNHLCFDFAILEQKHQRTEFNWAIIEEQMK